jgi:hypothetical protein
LLERDALLGVCAPDVLERYARACARALRRERERAAGLLQSTTRWLDDGELLLVIDQLDRLIERADRLVRHARALPRRRSRR